MRKRHVSEDHRQEVVRILAGISNGVHYTNPTVEHLQRKKHTKPLSMKAVCDRARIPRRIVRSVLTTMVAEGLVCTSQVSYNSAQGSDITITYYLNPERTDDYLHYLRQKDIASTDV